MTEHVRFVDAVLYGEADQAEVYNRFRSTGVVYESAGRLAVTAPGSMFVSVATGEAMVEGFWYKNDASKPLAIANNATGLTRTDRVVLRLDRNNNTLTAVILQGTAGAGAPALTQVVGGTYEFPLATVTVASGTLAITSSMIADARTYGKLLHTSDEIDAALPTDPFTHRRLVTVDPFTRVLHLSDMGPANPNRFHNASLRVNQRGIGGSATNEFICDRWRMGTVNNNASYNATALHLGPLYTGAVNSPVEGSYGIQLQKGAATAPANNTFIAIQQALEGLDVTPILHKSWVISFWLYSTKAGTYSISVEQVGSNNRYLASVTAGAAVWEYKYVVIPWNAGSSWVTTNASSLMVRFMVTAGSDYKSTGSNFWSTVATHYATSDHSNPLTATSDLVYFSTPKLEAGLYPTRFEVPDQTFERMQCYRYYYRERGILPLTYGNLSVFGIAHSLPVEMRVTPAFSHSTPLWVSGGPGASNQIALIHSSNYQAGPTFSSWAFWLGDGRSIATLLQSSTNAALGAAGHAGWLHVGTGVTAAFSAEI